MENMMVGLRGLAVIAVTGIIFFGIFSLNGGQNNLESSEALFVSRQEPCVKSNPCKIQIIADLDTDSKIIDPDSSKLRFRSYLLSGTFYKNANSYVIDWALPEVEIVGEINEAGRGMELSELLMFRDKLYTFDDRSGTVFELTKEGVAVPRYVLMEGDGNSKKGMKIEWATIKDGKMWIGSFGKEYTTATGQIVSENNFWVASIDVVGRITYYDWKPVYNTIRGALGASYPGYAIHEAVCWSPHMKKWVFLPRRVSSLPYDDKADEKMGSNKMVIADEEFSEAEVREVGGIVPERGYSSFKFVPGTKDTVILALKSVENGETGEQKSYITAFKLDGQVLLEDSLIPSAHKYEGLEIVM